jgi:hypothetical protein
MCLLFQDTCDTTSPARSTPGLSIGQLLPYLHLHFTPSMFGCS